jgi:hypothetical protein
MKAQEYLESLIEECKVYNDKSIQYKDIYAKLFPDLKGADEVKARILEMNEEELFEYFKSSNVALDVQKVFDKLASFIYFCKHIEIELDLTKLTEINSLANFISSFTPYKTELIVSDGELKEKNSKEFQKKFIAFKNSIEQATQMYDRGK